MIYWIIYYWIIYDINWSNQAANVIQHLLRLNFLSLSISLTEKAESNAFYKYEYEYTICMLYKTLEKNPTGNLKNHFWRSSRAVKGF